MFAVLAALGSALLVAVASVLQHRAGGRAVSPALRHVLRHPMWALGAASGVAGFGLHVLALSHGALTVVQPLLVSGLLFALPLSRALERRRVHVIDVAGAGAVVGGLALFQLTAHPSTGLFVAGTPALAACTSVIIAVVAVVWVFALRRSTDRGLWLGLAAGAAYGVVAALLKSALGVVALHGLAVFSAWPLYGFAVLVTTAIALNQLAFNAGPLAQSLPLITIVDPLVSVLIGALAFHETIASGAVPVAGQVLGFVLMSAGVLVLSRRAGRSQPRSSSTTAALGPVAGDLPVGETAPVPAAA